MPDLGTFVEQKEWPRDPEGFECSWWHGPLIAGIVATYPAAAYIEIGVYCGYCWHYAAPVAIEAHAVDIIDRSAYLGGMGRFWHMTSAEFFARYSGSAPDVVFIDGAHDQGTCETDLRSALTILAPGGVIALHDGWPLHPASLHLTGDVWKIRKACEADPDLETFTFPRFPGITLVRKC